MDNFVSKIKYGFTLAEVLITLVIVGIVAALTIPVVVQNSWDKATVTALKKNFNVFGNALKMAAAFNGDIYSWSFSDYLYTPENTSEEKNLHTLNIDPFVNKLQISKDCGHGANGCFEHRYTRLAGGTERDFENLSYYRKAVLNDGTLIAVQGYGFGSSGNIPETCGEIWVDINGAKKPNVVDRDMFLLLINCDGMIVPYGLSGLQTTNSITKSNINYKGAGWVLNKENIDYLHCDGLSWSGKSSCF